MSGGVSPSHSGGTSPKILNWLELSGERREWGGSMRGGLYPPLIGGGTSPKILNWLELSREWGGV